MASNREKAKRDLERRVDFIEQHVTIDELLDHLKVERSRGKILCVFPDHQERTPSMVVYPDTNSVHCFGCGKSANVIGVVRHCVPQSGVWSKERAVEWIERTFKLNSGHSAPAELKNRISRRIATKKKTQEASHLGVDEVTATALRVREEILNGVPRTIVLALSSVEDYLWAELERVPPQDWLPWALSILRGHYRNTINTLSEVSAVSQQLPARIGHGEHEEVDLAGSLLRLLPSYHGAPGAF